MDGFLRQSTADDILLGPFTDSTDGDTAETALTINQADVRLSKNGQNMGQKSDVTACVHDEIGMYNCELDTTDVNTTGILTVIVHVTGALVVKQTYQVLDPLSYDALFASTATILTSKDIGQLYESTIGTINTPSSFDMDITIVSDDNWIGNTVTIEDITNGETVTRWVADVDQVNDRIIINSSPGLPFTAAVGDILRVESRIHPTYALETFAPPTRVELTADTDSILNKMLAYFRVALRNDAAIATDQATEITAINADEASGAGTYNNTTDSLEATWQTVLTEAYAVDGAAGTATQILYAIQQFLYDADIAGTTMTIRKLDGTTQAAIVTLDDATTPTDKNRTA